MRNLCIMFLLITMSISSLEVGKYSFVYHKPITAEYIVYHGDGNMIPIKWELEKKIQIYNVYENKRLIEKGFKFSNFWLVTDYKSFNDLIYLTRSQMVWKARIIGIENEVLYETYNVFICEQGEKVHIELQDTANSFCVVLNINKCEL